MFNQRQNVDIDTMMGQAPTPGRRRPPTPIRKVGGGKPLLNKENQWGNNNDFGRQDGVKKPLISPVRNPFKNQIDRQQNQMPRNNGWVENFENRGVCKNHTGKQAEFQIQIDGDMLSYCNRCAAQLASQGFEVSKIEPSTVKKGGINQRKSQNMGRSLPRYPEYEGNPMYELILQFLTDLSQVENQHLHNMQKLTQIDNNYEKQIEHTTDFYSQLLSFIEQMRDDHLADLHEESRKHSQIADIQHDYLRENVDEMGSIRNDIEENMETIVEKLDQEDLRNNLNYYKQKTEVYRQKVEEQAQFFEKLIVFTPDQYTQKLTKVQDFMMDVWSNDQDESNPQKEYQSMHQRQFPMQKQPLNKQMPNRGQNDFNFPQQQQQQNYFRRPQPQSQRGMGKPFEQQGRGSGQKENQPAFRILFDDQDQLIAETSPQFKKI